MAVSESALVEKRLCIGFDAGAAVSTGPDSVLVDRLKRGERAAYEELIATYQGLVYGLALRLLGNPEDAHDIAQETFLKAYRHIGTFRSECGLKTWLYRLTVNQTSNHRRWWRRRKRDETVSLETPVGDASGTLGDRIPSRNTSPEETALLRERQKLLMTALESLRHDYRVAVVLRDIEELSYEEISETTSVPVGTVKSRIARGRDELRRQLERLGV